MKSSLILVAGAALLYSACTPIPMPLPGPGVTRQAATAGAAAPYTPATVAAPQTYSPQAYVPQQPAAQPVVAMDPMTGQPVVVQQQPLYTVDPATGQFVQVAAPVGTTPTAPADITAQQQPVAAATAPAPQQPAPAAGASANYALQMINGTTGRLFVEVFDDSDNVFPIGYLFAGQNISTPPSEARNIQGQLTVVIRDPDANGKELRRYKVTPPADYTNKTIGVTILPGGRYRASVDGQVYYTSPDPKPQAPAAAPAPAPAAAPAANPATESAPIL